VLSERIGFKRLHWQNIFLTHDQGRSQDFSKGGAEVMEAKAL